MAEIQALSSRLEVQNAHLTSDMQQCEHSRSETSAEAAKQLELKQKAHDDKVGHICALMCLCGWGMENKREIHERT